MSGALAAIVDGRRLPDDEARSLWERFSAHMDEHRGDFEGFARREGYASARVAVQGGVPTLTLARAAAEGGSKRRKRRRPRR